MFGDATRDMPIHLQMEPYVTYKQDQCDLEFMLLHTTLDTMRIQWEEHTDLTVQMALFGRDLDDQGWDALLGSPTHILLTNEHQHTQALRRAATAAAGVELPTELASMIIGTDWPPAATTTR